MRYFNLPYCSLCKFKPEGVLIQTRGVKPGGSSRLKPSHNSHKLCHRLLGLSAVAGACTHQFI